MITLLTGAPGAGKTALLVEWLRTLYADRPLYVHGLAGLQLPHTPVDAARWHEDLPDGAVLVVDEVQQVWRPRGPGHAPSAAVQALETHRHRGIDVFLTTQKPNLLDANVRGLVGRHVHLRDTGWLGRRMYEWPECSDNLAWKTCPLKSKFKLPRKSFELYKSATVHSQAARGKSLMPVITGGLVVAFVGLAVMVYRTIAEKVKPAETVADAAPAFSARPSASPAPAARRAWPVYDAEPVSFKREPYTGRALQLEGQWEVGGVVGAVFGLVVDGERVATVSLAQVVAMGYVWTYLGPCAGVLRHGVVERLITCGKRVEPEARRERRREPDGAPDQAQARKMPVALF